MAIRGLIVAVQKYDVLREELGAEDLPGTIDFAVGVRNWLIERKGANSDDILFCSSPQVPNSTAGATYAEIRKAILDLIAKGAGDTEELYFVYSGHGFAQIGIGRRPLAIALIPADFIDAEQSANLCIKHAEIVNRLRTDLGPGVHFHFIDACRSERPENKFPVGVLAIPERPMATGYANVHILYSTSHGAIAEVGAGFGSHVVDALHGKSRAKIWRPRPGDVSRLVVRFDSLAEYVKSKSAGQIPESDPGDGSRDEIYEFKPPIPENPCDVVVTNAAEDDDFQLTLTDSIQQVLSEIQFKGGQTRLMRRPNDYFLSLSHQSDVISPSGLLPVDLYEPAKVEFVKGDLTRHDGLEFAESAAPPHSGRLKVTLPPKATARLQSLTRDVNEYNLQGVSELSLPADRYELVVADQDGRETLRLPVAISRWSKLALDLANPAPTGVQRELMALASHDPSQPNFSETLGPLVDRDPAVWLSIVAASAIIGQEQFSRLKDVPLADFSVVQRGQSALYVVMGLERTFGPLRCSLGISGTREQPQACAWKDVSSIVGFEHHFHCSLQTPAGQQLLSLQIGSSVLTLSTIFLPNRATLIVVTQDEQEAIQINQMILPIAHLRPHLPDIVQQNVFSGEYPLRNVRFIAQSQRAFRQRRSRAIDQQTMSDLLYGKWLDPVMAVMAAYELIRVGERESLRTAAHNLRTYFSEIPDAIVIWNFTHPESRIAEPPDLPIFLEGITSSNFAPQLPLPATKLDLRGIWTLWRGAVAANNNDVMGG